MSSNLPTTPPDRPLEAPTPATKAPDDAEFQEALILEQFGESDLKHATAASEPAIDDQPSADP